MYSLRLFLVSCILLLFINTTYPQWSATNGIGPGAAVRCFTVSGNQIFAGSWGGPNGYAGGVFISTDEGANWLPRNTGLTDTAVFALIEKDAVIFAATLGGGVFKSTDNGNNWISASNGLTNINTTAFAISEGRLFCGTYEGVFRSTDDGTNWIGVNNGFPSASPFIINDLAVIGSNLFAATAGYGVFLSTDNGDNWTEINNGLTNTNVLSLGVSGTNLFAGTFSGVFLSSDNGINWINTQGLAGTIVEKVLTVGSNLFAGSSGGGVFFSTDNGSNWTSVGTGIPNTTVYTLAVAGSKIFAGTLSGVVYRRELSEIVTSAENVENQLAGFYLEQNYPNPFNPTTMITFSLKEKSFVTLKVYNVIGKESAVLADGEKEAGEYSIEFNASNFSSGVYFYTLEAGGLLFTRKMILIK